MNMSSLPDPAIADTNQTTVQPPVSGFAPTTHGGKEIETGMGSLVPEIPGLKEYGKDVELPKEVAQVGVRVVPTTVTLPAHIAAAGVVPAGQAIPIASGATVTLPLTNDQISAGLTQNVSSSIRWLAEWCVKRIKQLHAMSKGTQVK